jgi:hypothetical protein
MPTGVNPYSTAQETAELREALVRTQRQLSQSNAKTQDLVAAVYQAAKDVALTLTLPPVTPPARDRRKGTPETAVAILSDWQLGKVTPTYSSAICEERIALYGDKVLKLARVQRADHPVRELRVYLLGDLVEGELIFPGQAYRIDSSLYRQVLADGPRILGGFLRRMSADFDRVHVVGVIGNHGALGGPARRDYHPESNADAMMYEATRLVLEDDKRITWASNLTRGERHWYALDTVGTKTFMLFHGDQIKGGFAGFPWYGFDKKVKGWALGAVPRRFDYALSGHFHTPVRMLISGIVVWGSGSTESMNTYAAEQLAAQGSPCQWLLFAHPDRGVTAEYLVPLD